MGHLVSEDSLVELLNSFVDGLLEDSLLIVLVLGDFHLLDEFFDCLLGLFNI